MAFEHVSTSWLWSAVIAILLADALGIPTGTNECQQNFSCGTDCTEGSSFQPQKCLKCCPQGGGDGSASGFRSDNVSERLAEVEEAVSELRVMTGVLLGLVVLLVLVVVVLLLHLNKDLAKKVVFPVLFRNKGAGSAQDKDGQKNCNGIVIANSSAVSRLADHQSKTSPQTKRSSVSRSTLGNADLEPQPSPYRVRQPSESTCPEEGNDSIPQGYDNLALSTSTIESSTTVHNTSTSSTDTLGPALSTNTLHTTLPSENPLSSDEHNTRI